MLNALLLAAVLVGVINSDSQPVEKTNAVFPARLAGAWQSDSTASNRLGAESGVLSACNLLAFRNTASWNEMKTAFIDPHLVDAPLHIGGVRVDNDADALFVLRGRIGFYEIGTTPGGGGVEKVQWETLHLIQGSDASNDMLVIGQTIYKRQR